MKNKIFARNFNLIKKTATGAKLGIIVLRENIFIGGAMGTLVGSLLHLYFYFGKADFATLGRYAIPIFAFVGLVIGLFSGMERKRTVSFKEQTRILLKEIQEKERLIQENQSKTEELQGILIKLNQTQEQLIQEGKMVSLGSLATGIAHQLNQPLTAIRGFVQIILKKLDKSSRFYREIVCVENQTTYMMDVISNLGGFSRVADERERSCSVNQCIDKALELVNDQFRLKQIEVEKDLRPDLPLVKIEPIKMEQVLINFFLNAEEAMSALPPDATRKLRLSTNLRKGDLSKVEIVISDTGPGIAEKDRDRIFEAFFTTKGPSAMGLGLYLNYAIIHERSGIIECERKKKQGAEFRVILPAFLPPPPSSP